MTLRYILVQLIGLCGTLLFFFSYQCKSNRRLFQVQFASYVFYTAHLLLLGAVTFSGHLREVQLVLIALRQYLLHRQDRVEQ